MQGGRGFTPAKSSRRVSSARLIQVNCFKRETSERTSSPRACRAGHFTASARYPFLFSTCALNSSLPAVELGWHLAQTGTGPSFAILHFWFRTRIYVLRPLMGSYAIAGTVNNHYTRNGEKSSCRRAQRECQNKATWRKNNLANLINTLCYNLVS